MEKQQQLSSQEIRAHDTEILEDTTSNNMQSQQENKYSCRLCKMPDTDLMVQCDKCDNWFHFSCVNVDENVANIDWKCQHCQSEPIELQSRKSVSVTSSVRQKLLQLELKKLEEEQAMIIKRQAEERSLLEKQRIEEVEFLKKKYETLQQVAIEDASSNNSAKSDILLQDRSNRTTQWVKCQQKRLKPKLNDKNEQLNDQIVDSQRSVYLGNQGQVKQQSRSYIKTRSYQPELPPYRNENQENQQTDQFQLHDKQYLSSEQITARQALSFKNNLPVFNGNPSEWPIFYSNFVESTQRCGYSNQENLIRLQQCLRGKALEAVRSMLLIPDTVPIVLENLKLLFGRPEIIINSLINKIRNEPIIKIEKIESFINFSMIVQNLIATMKASKLTSHLNNPMLLQELIEKLPINIKLDWARYTADSDADQEINLLQFNEWLFKQARAASSVTYNTSQIQNYSFENKFDRYQKKSNYLQATHTETSTDTEIMKKKCLMCDSTFHKIQDCYKFKELTKNQRWNVVKQKKACKHCLGSHYAANCKDKRVCAIDGCQRYHHNLLHNSNYVKQITELKKSGDKEMVTLHYAHLMSRSSVLFRIIPVRVFNKKICIDTYAFLDDGSSLTLMEESLAEQLQLEGPTTNLHLKWSNDISRKEEKSKIVSCKISGIDDVENRYCMLNIRTVRNLGLPVQSFNFDTNEKQYQHLLRLPVSQYSNASPRLLIGLDNWRLCIPFEIREGLLNCPIAARTRLGWVVSGPNQNSNNTVQEGHTFHISECECDKVLHQCVKDYFSIDNFGVKIPQRILESSADTRSRYLLKTTTVRKNRRFETGLLWKHDQFEFPDSLPMAKKRLLCLENKMVREKDLEKSLKQQLKEYIEKGYTRKLLPEEVTKHSRVWYLPIFITRNPNKPKKMRIVWDAAAKVNGVSLNSMLLTGPDQLPSLIYVLYKFRQGLFAITGDIKEMFHQVQIRKEDQHSQRFLWRDGEQNREPDIYVMQVMTFGATCAPSSAQYVKNINAEEFKQKYPRAVQAIQENHYVDDWLDSFNSEDELIQITNEVRFVHSQGGFEIRNWISNSQRALVEIGQASDLTTKTINEEEGKILGMRWNTSTDVFIFKINRQKIDMNILDGSRYPTKREVLRTLMCIFDPLGLLSSFLVHLKILLQEIWRSSISWDEKILKQSYVKWQKWCERLWDIEKLQVPRCYIKSNNTHSVQLHVFVDASENAYAAVAYFRIEDEKAAVHCALVGSKTKVAPQKPISIPRMELQAAVLGARLSNSIFEGHSIKITKRIMWTDSKTVLQWLKSDARKYRQFVALRIGEILDTTNVTEWRWIPSIQNIADEATKWKESPLPLSTSQWFTGPDFLFKSEEDWPANNLQDGLKADNELRECLVHVGVEIYEPICPNIHYFSNWKRLIRAQVYFTRAVIKFMTLIKKNKTEPISGPILPEEINEAEIILYRKAQWDFYADEIVTLHTNNELDNTSNLHSLNPYLESGVLRIHGRIDNADGVPFDTKRPIILPRKHVITDLIINHYHQTYHHRNNEVVVNEIRQKYFIPKLRVCIKKLKNICQKCKNSRVTSKMPQMCELPKSRLAAFCKPFTYVGIDYFGPIEVVIGRRKEKRWGVLFTCMTIRAVHIEIANNLSTNSCIQCLKEFIFTRGCPNEIYSDNGTNFRGAKNELFREIMKIDQNLLTEFSPKIKWSFIPPASPHMGGSWERLIRTVKSNLSEVLQIKNPTCEVLRSALKEIEFIINSRPLTYIPLDSEEDEALTPNHFLLGSSNGSKSPVEFYGDGSSLKNDWKLSQAIAHRFWKRWLREYLPTLTRRTKWFTPTNPLKVGDVVIIIDQNNPRNTWPKGMIKDVIRSKDGQVRSAIVRTAHGTFTRPAVKLAVLDVK